MKERIVASQQRMSEFLPAKGFRAVKPEMMHVTLAFVGEVREEDLTEIKSRAAQLCSDAPPTKLVFEGVGCFPAWKHPRVIWVGATEDGYIPFDQNAPMATLGRKLIDACSPFSKHVPEERVLLHVTLARSSDRLKKEDMVRLGQLASADFWTGFGEKTTRSIVLYESTLTKGGPVQHIALARFPLKS